MSPIMLKIRRVSLPLKRSLAKEKPAMEFMEALMRAVSIVTKVLLKKNLGQSASENTSLKLPKIAFWGIKNLSSPARVLISPMLFSAVEMSISNGIIIRRDRTAINTTVGPEEPACG